ncbi:MAG: DUF3108 domain-containing protein [Opitutales bacterium]
MPKKSLAIAGWLLSALCFAACTSSELSTDPIVLSEVDPALPSDADFGPSAPDEAPVVFSEADPPSQTDSTTPSGELASSETAANVGLADAPAPVIDDGDLPAADHTNAPRAPGLQGEAPPFRISERLYYDLKWEALKVGEGLMMVEGPEEIDGIPCYKLSLTIRTDPVIDLVYKVRTRIYGWAQLNMQRSLLYTKRQIEGKTNRDVRVTFDWDGKTSHYTNWNRPHKPAVDLKEDGFDPISAVYFFRTLDLRPGQNYYVPLTDGKKWVDGSIDALRYEEVEVPLGKFDALLVRPDVGDAGGVFKKSPNAEVLIWLSNDRYHIPVKMASSVVVGDFSAELRAIEVEAQRGIPEGMAYNGPPDPKEIETGPRR